MKINNIAKLLADALTASGVDTAQAREALAAYQKLAPGKAKGADPSYVAQFERLHKSLRTRTQVQLADKLGVRQSSISDANRRQSLPSGWVEVAFMEHGVNPAYVRLGQEPMYLREVPRG